ncbi:MAG: LysE family transporter [Bacteroidetes bacterium]|nr:LysE family transporter [Bacteroidota bacterium]
MTRQLKLYGWALLISCAGSLPIGTLNAQVANLSIGMDYTEAMLFGLGAILVEVLLVRIAIIAVQRLNRLKRFFKLFSILASILLLFFGYVSLRAAIHMQMPETIFPYTRQHPFLTGLVLSSVNPLHLPFWMGWTAVLRQKGLLADSSADCNVYVAAIGSGTALAFLLYGMAGNLFLGFLMGQQDKINWAVGFALLGAGVVQVYKTWRTYISTSNS